MSTRSFSASVRQLMAYCKKCKAIQDEQLSKQQLIVRNEELERRFGNVQNYYDECIRIESQESDEDTEAVFDQQFEDASEVYMETKAMLLGKMEEQIPIPERTTTEAQDSNTTVNQGVQQSQGLRLPTINIPSFEGGYAKWPAFRDLFCGVFQNLSAGQKLAHLHDRTRGEAKDIVTRFDIVDANFELAWQALVDRYENKRILVHQQMKKLFGIQTIHQESPRGLRGIQSAINDSLAIFNSHKVETTNWDPILIHFCTTKIPEETLRAWEDSLESHKTLPTWSQMDKYLSCRIEKLETVLDLRKPLQREQPNHKTQGFHIQNREDNGGCLKCNQKHMLWQCQEFRALSNKERNKFVMENRCCLNCLTKGHFVSKCTSKWVCKHCNKKHHSMIHIDREDRQRFHAATNAQSFQPTRNDISAHFSQSESTTILPTALINLNHAGENFSIRALLDAGAEKSFISSRIQQKLQLPIEKHHAQISGIGGTVVSKSKGRCNVLLGSKHSNFKIHITAIIVPKLSHLLPSRLVKLQNIEEIKNLELADPNFHKPGPIDMIIGSDFLPLINREGMKVLEGCLEARSSNFGWYISGPAPTDSVQTFSTTVSENTEICSLLKRFWELEDVEPEKNQSDSDIFCEEFYKSTTTRGNDGKYVVRLPFKKEYPDQIYLGPSKNMAFAQYSRMENTLSKSPELEKQYSSVLQEYEDMQHMEEVREVEKGDKVSSFFLPHHAVVKPESTSTKVRVVFNASKKTKSGYSLNDVLHTGPILQSDIVQVITNWRFYQFVFTGDIQKMYRQIWIHPDDQPFQRIVFRRIKKEAVKTFQLKTVTFGIKCAPFLAIRTLHELSKDVESKNPTVSNILSKEVYVDDILSGGHSLNEAKMKQTDLKTVLASAGFPVKKVAANHANLLDYLPREDLLNEEFLKIDTCSITKTLGVRWNAIADVFSYTVQPIETPKTVTKRQMLSVIAKLFDPQGWIGPVVVIAKMYMQELWELKTDWDDEVPTSVLTKWLTFLTELHQLQELQIPRWVNFSSGSTIQLHGFCDASEKAFCGAVYIRVVGPMDETHCHLMVAKTKVAPLQPMTIPKLELCGASLVTKLVMNVSRHLQVQHEITLWTDSSIVIGWLQRKPQTLKTFVANRVGEIQKLIPSTQWRHIKTEENPADLGSRGCTPHELRHSKQWWHGPSWLTLPQEKWPKPRSFEPTDIEVKISAHFTAEVIDITSRFSSLERCFRVVSYIFRFYFNLKKKITIHNSIYYHR